jgi:ASC-1-like (ASCH) protein
MRLQDGPFKRMFSGTKILELRLCDEKRQMIRLGDEVEFSKASNPEEKINMQVTGLLIYKTFAELVQDMPATYLGYSELDKEYLKKSMYEIYSPEDEAKYGVLGIKLRAV